MPFSTEPRHKTAFTVGYVTFFGLGLSLPLVAVFYQLYVRGAPLSPRSPVQEQAVIVL